MSILLNFASFTLLLLASSSSQKALWVASSLVFALFWGPRALLGKLPRQEARRRVPTLFSSALLVGWVALFQLTMSLADDPLVALGTPTAWSMGLCVVSLAYGVFSVAAAVWLGSLRRRSEENPPRRWTRAARAYNLSLAGAHLFITIYLLCHGFIGLRTWAY